MKGPVAYISHYFPALTQTFVYREVLAMEEAGWRIVPFGIRRPTKGISEEARELAQRTRYVAPPRLGQAIARNLTCLLRHPCRYLGGLWHLVSRPGERFAARVHGLTHFLGAMSIVPDLERAGVRHFHAHFGQNPATIAMAAADYLGIPFSMTIHARDLFVNTHLLRAKLARAKFVVTISEYNARLLRQMAGDRRRAARVHVLHCGVDIRRFDARTAPPTPAGATPPVFFAVGRLVEKKGYVHLVAAARLLRERGVPFRIRIVGGGPDQPALERQIADLGVGDCVRLEGPMPQEKLLPLLRSADAFVLPCVRAQDGDQDGIPVSLMEAMAYGIPCVSTELSGIPELIESGKEGLLVPEKDPRALAAALECLARDPGLRATMGRAARAKVEAEFTMQRLVRGLEDLLSEG